MIRIKLNGKDWEVAPKTTVADLLARLKIIPKVCVVELNGEILSREKYLKTAVKSGDRIEVIRIMGGG
jgi:sulfur carrier protein